MSKAQLFIGRILVSATLLLGITGAAWAQSPVDVTGRINDDEGNPLAGVTIVVKGTAGTGTITDGQGAYKLTVPEENSVLMISYIGYASLEIPIDGRTVVDVTLQPDAIVADELVVIGYGVQRKSHLTGSIAKVEGSALVDMPVSDIAQALQGKITGVTIDNTTSEVGVAPQIRVRGVGSLSSDGGPLVVVDGFPTDVGLQAVNASDIQSIEILKDAASSAIYGSEAANGVIMITTKSGSIESPKYTIKLYSGMKFAYKLHDMYTDLEYYNLVKDEYENYFGQKAPSTNYRIAAWLESQIGATDWQKEAMRDMATINSVTFSMSGGKKESRYYVSGGYVRDQGVMLQNEVQKVNVRAKLDGQISRSVSFGINFSAAYSKSDRPVNNFINFYRTPSSLPVMHNDFTTSLTGYTGYARGNHFTNISAPAGDPDPNNFNNPAWITGTLSSSAQNNPKSILDRTDRGSEMFQSVGSAYLSVNLFKHLTFMSQNTFEARLSPAFTFSEFEATADDALATATFSSPFMLRLQTSNTFTYDNTFGNHGLNIMIGQEARTTRRERTQLRGLGFPTDKIHTLNAATSFVIMDENGNMQTGTERTPDERKVSVMGRVNWDYKDKYLVSAVLRADWFSFFGIGNKGSVFPSVSVGWRMDQEPFMKSVSWINALKLRASYGVTGSTSSVDFRSSQQLYDPATYPFGEGTGSVVPGLAVTGDTMANPDITWEQTDEWNVGLDVSLLKNRINLSFDAYYAITRNLLFTRPIPSFTGFTDVWDNIGRIRNGGIEVELETRNISNRNFSWSTNLLFSMNRNRVIELGGERQIISYGEVDEQYIARVGEPAVQYYGFKTIGVWNTMEEIAENPSYSGDAPGKLRFADIDGSGYIDANDMTTLGNPYPDFTWSMTNSLNYRNFDLSILIQGVQGISVYNRDGNYNESQKWNKAYTKNRWISPQFPGDGKTVTFESGSDARAVFSDYFIENASYATLRNVTLGYTFGKKITDKLHISGLRLYASGNNLFYIWSKDFRGIDPEARKTSGSYASPLVQGYQVGGYPINTTVTFGLDLTF